MNKRTLSERQSRWNSVLVDPPSTKFKYRLGKEAARPNALSRPEQDTPKSPNDPRLRYRETQLIEDSWLAVIEEAH